jgi:AraC family transcriptional regulator of adaptative response/methylated-DNA-[protein]-cysteine methyltransferase
MEPSDYQAVAMILDALDEKSLRQTRKEPARCGTDLNRSAVDQLFLRWAGVDLARFLAPFHQGRIHQKITETARLLSVSGPMAEEFPLQSPDRGIQCSLLDLSSRQPQTPGAGMTIRHGRFPSPFGDCLLAESDGAICHLFFPGPERDAVLVNEVRRTWPGAVLLADNTIKDGRRTGQIFTPEGTRRNRPVRLLLAGTSFQLRVWRALLAIPPGAMISYQGLAEALGQPTASRAVASAVAANPISYLIPCHRVIRKSGDIHHYRWGRGRKIAMLGWEARGK